MLDLYGEVSRTWAQVYGETQELTKLVMTGKEPVPDMADCALLLKKTIEKLENMRAECNKVLGTIEKQSCLVAAMAGQHGPIRGELCTATPRPGLAPPNIKRSDDPAAYDEIMMGAFGFSKEACEMELARVYYPGAEAYIQKLMAEGKPVPKALKGLEMRPTYGLTCRAASGVDLDAMLLTRSRSQGESHEHSRTVTVDRDYQPASDAAATPNSDSPF